MNKFSLLTGLMLFFFTFSLFGQNSKGSRPNIILIVSDDHRHDWMHHKGKSYMKTPNLDRLAEEGWSFPNAFGVAGVCSPARASLLTGKYMHQASTPDIEWQNNSFLHMQKMFPQRLHKEGYRTGYIGKFHLGEGEKSKSGFDYWASFPFVGYYTNPTLWINGTPMKKEGFTDDVISSLASNKISEWSSSKKPFAMIVGLKSPHIPFDQYPKRMDDLYSNVTFEKPETFDINYSQNKPGLKNNLINAKTWPHAIPKYGSFQDWVRAYTRTATTIDQSVGKIMKAVERSGISDNTIFIYTSDHGYSLGEFSLCEKHYAYDQVMRVPLIVRFPDQKNPGKPPSDMVSHIDIAPTVMDYATGKIPEEMMGKSWRNLLQPNRKKEPFREEIFFDFWHNNRDILPPMQAVRTKNYKLIDYEYKQYKELYDLQNDPSEKHNLVDDPEYASIKNKLEKKLRKWKKKTGWVNRSSKNLNSIYLYELLTPEEEQQKKEDLRKLNVTDIVKDKGAWGKVRRDNNSFNLEDHLPQEDGQYILYAAVPLINQAEFDPFMTIRFSFPNSSKTSLPLSGFFEEKEIYKSYKLKKMLDLPNVDKREKGLRKGFDNGYNPPLKTGQNVILLRILVDNNTPSIWNISAVGGISAIKWL